MLKQAADSGLREVHVLGRDGASLLGTQGMWGLAVTKICVSFLLTTGPGFPRGAFHQGAVPG